MSHLPEKLHHQRMKIQLESIESPSDFQNKKICFTGNGSGSSQKKSVAGIFSKHKLQHLDFLNDSPVTLTKYSAKSPMSDLAFNLGGTSINAMNSPSPASPAIKKTLNMDIIESSPSPSSSHGHSSDSSTPLSSITNKPKARSLIRSNTAPYFSYNEANKENIPTPKSMSSRASPLKATTSSRSSPRKSPAKPFDSPLSLKDRRTQFHKLVHSPESFKSSDTKTLSLKRPRFKVLEDDDSSRDSGYASQPAEDSRMRKKSRQEAEVTSMKDILENCSPSKNEEGLTPLVNSPGSKSSKSTSDGFDLDSLEDIPEEDEEIRNSSTTFSSLMDKKILVDNDTRPRAFSSSGSASPIMNSRSFRRALSMVDSADSPITRDPKMFKRPEPPLHVSHCQARKRKPGAMVERSVSLQYNEKVQLCRPVFQRSQSEMTISTGESTKESCEMMENNPDLLPDAHGVYSLPSQAGLCKRHPNLRSITCHTLAELLAGKHRESINSFRIIDVRYKFEYEGGHINGAENWQHGEDEEFLEAILPLSTPPLQQKPDATVSKNSKRDIVIFHCEFSSQRAPDFYTKLRERDRSINLEVYPGLYYPECYLLHLGFKEFFHNYPELVSGNYTEMIDPGFTEELRQMRAKSKSWAGGTVARTGAMSRRKRQ